LPLLGAALFACSTGGAVTSKRATSGREGQRANTSGDRPAATGAAAASAAPRLIAYVNCLCGFGVGSSDGACLDEPDPTINHVERWEQQGVSPITHYVIAFLSFEGATMVSDRTSVWASGGGGRADFELDDHLKSALRAAQAHGKRVVLSLGGELGSARFLDFWRSSGASSSERVAGMRAELERVARAFATQNTLRVDAFDIDLELGGRYLYASEKYLATRDLIDAVPEPYAVAFAPQISNGLCAAPSPGSPLGARTTLGGDCDVEPNDVEQAWALTRLDQDCTRRDGRPKLEYFGVQYYNAGADACCGGGNTPGAMIESTLQSYAALAEGWPASSSAPATGAGPSYAWPAFAGVGAQRLVLGKPGCAGCAANNYLELASMQQLLARLDRRLRQPPGGLFFWDLCRVFGKAGGLCAPAGCQPSWGGAQVLQNLRALRNQMAVLRTAE
jgi:hypothetical protein